MPSSTSAAAAAAASSADNDAQQRPRKRPKIRRTTFACARCHRRKIKCDGLKPVCSGCVQAKQPCNGILDGESKTVVPRSIAQYLQEKIAEKELHLQRLGVDPETDPANAVAASARGNISVAATPPAVGDSHPARAPDPPWPGVRLQQRYDLASEASRSFSAGLSKSLLISRASFPYGTFLFASSHLPSATPAPVDLEVKDDYFRTKAKSNALEQIPKDVTERLVRNYIERISPLYPFLDRQELRARFTRVHNGHKFGHDVPSQYDVFVVSMMTAVSIMTSKFSDSSKIASSSERIFRYALNHSDALYETSFLSLQATLLLIQYSYLMPRAASLWDIVGLAMRMAQELGLHRDPEEHPGHGFTEAEVELRRSVFWVLYIFDRSICGASHRRLGIADESISTKYPSGMEGTYFLHNVRFRRMQSELWTVNYLRRGLPLLTEEGSYEAWAEDIEQRMRSWCAQIKTKKSSGPEWFDIAIWHGFVFLYRPCPRNPNPPMKSLIKCFEAATQVAAGYWENAHSGFLKYSWHAVHHGFESAIAMLYAIRHCKEQLKELYGTRKILETVHLFSSLFVLMSERWSQAHAILDSYERCKSIVMRELTQPNVAPTSTENDELDRMILPQQAQQARGDRWDGDVGESNTWASATLPYGASQPSQQSPLWATSAPVDTSSLTSAASSNRPLTILRGSPSPYPQPAMVPPAEPSQPQAQHQHQHQVPSSQTPSSHQMHWPAPHHSQQQQQQQHHHHHHHHHHGQEGQHQHNHQPIFSAGGGPEYQSLYDGYDMWTPPGQAHGSSSNTDWEEMVIQPDSSGVDGMILWTM